MYNCGFRQEYIQKVYVVFVDNTSLWWLKFLKKGFRHCYIIFQLGNNPQLLIELNPMSNQFYVFKHISHLGCDYIFHLKQQDNIKIIPIDIKQAELKTAPIGIFSCVEFVKRVLGIHSFWLFTPYQLYKFLTKTKNSRKKVLTNDFF